MTSWARWSAGADAPTSRHIPGTDRQQIRAVSGVDVTQRRLARICGERPGVGPEVADLRAFRGTEYGVEMTFRPMTKRDPPRGFSLIEIMVVVAILSVISALAVPNLLPVMKQVQLSSEADAVAAFLSRAQLEAMAKKRCVKVEITNGGRTLVASRLNVFDCDINPGSAPVIESGLGTWIQFASHTPGTPTISLSFDPAPSESGTEIRFRPSGRLWSADEDVSDDDGVIKVTHGTLTGTNTTKVLAEAQGLICVLKRGENPGGLNNNLSCPN